MCLLLSADFFFLKKKSFRNTIRVSNSFDPVDPDLGWNSLQKLSVDDRSES